MSTELVVIFSKNYEDTQSGYLNDMGLSELDAPNKEVAAVRPDMSARFWEDSDEPSNVDVLFVIDNEVSQESKEILARAISPREAVLVFMHSGSTSNMSNQLTAIETLVGARQFRRVIDHSNSGGVYDALCRLARAVKNQDAHQYQAAIRGLRKQFIGDPVLEAKLYLLHKCLTPEGAGEVSIELRDGGSAELKKLGQRKALFAHTAEGDEKVVWKVEDLVQALTPNPAAGQDAAKHIKFSDEFDRNYIRAVAALRDALLTEK